MSNIYDNNSGANGDSFSNGCIKYKILTLGTLSDNDTRDEKPYEYNQYVIGKPVEILDENDQVQTGKICRIVRDVKGTVLKIYFISEKDSNVYPAYPHQVQKSEIADKYPTSSINSIGEIPVGTTMPAETMYELKSPLEFRKLYEAEEAVKVSPQELEWDYWKSNLDSQYPFLKNTPEMADHLLSILKCGETDLVAIFETEYGYSYLKSILKEASNEESFVYDNDAEPVIFNTYIYNGISFVEILINNDTENISVIFTKYTPNMTLLCGN